MHSRNASVELDLKWVSEEARHSDKLFVPRIDFWRDFFPGTLGEMLSGLVVGQDTSQTFTAGELVPAHDSKQVITIREGQFHRDFGHLSVEPRLGRYYPRGMIAGVAGIFASEYKPFRIVGRDGDQLEVDLNHPLARYSLELSATIVEELEPRVQHGGSCHDIADMVTEKGPGLQALSSDLHTDFFHDYPFVRLDDNKDSIFYQMPRLVEHVDAVATREISRIYDRLLPRGGKVLDLMSSWISHLPEDLDVSVAGLGLNEEELAKNPRLGSYVLHDLNRDPRLPYEDAAFNAVICANSVEYLTAPLEVFADVARVLKPGGVFINVFSERWFPPKVISVWAEMHPFERMGLVLEGLRRTGRYGDLHSESVRGHLRPDDDKYRGMTPHADPVYAVWGSKAD